VKNQYFGDINDYRKYGLLRCFSDGAFRVGLCWMLTAPDGSGDGNQTAYLDDPTRWRRHDPQLFDFLKERVATRRRDVRQFEASDLPPRAVFFSDTLSDDAERRATYWVDAARSLAATDLVFFDPDNGLEVTSVPYGRRESCRYLYWREVKQAAEAGMSLVVFQHWRRQNRKGLVESLSAELRSWMPAGADILAIGSAFVLFLAACQPEHRDRFAKALGLLAKRWAGQFEIA